MIGFPQNGLPFVELIVLIDFQNTSPNDEQYKHLLIVAHTYMIFEKDGKEVRNWGDKDLDWECESTRLKIYKWQQRLGR